MATENRNSPRVEPHEATLDAPTDEVFREKGARVHLVQGSTPAISGETQCILRRRLRAAALMMCSGFVAFGLWLFWYYVVSPWFWRSERVLPHGMLAAHTAVTMLLGLCAGSLCRGCEISLRQLRIKELLIFGVPALYFVYFQVLVMSQWAVKYQVLPSIIAPWLLLIFTYALFIPNTWRRACAIVGVMAAAPVLLATWTIYLHPEIRAAANADWAYIVEHAIMALLAAASSVVGVHTIGSLRMEVFRARELGQYRLRERLGGGGMGDVFLAEHQLMKRPCAIKLIRPERAGDPTALARFEREVRATAKLSHWNNIDIFDYGRAEDGTFYYVMEYLPGKNLAELVDQHGPLEPARVAYLLRQVCDALTEAHGMGLLHRDIKPANIFAAQRGGFYDVAKLLDFGLVKPITAQEGSDLTQEGSITGSPLYMSPEQALGDREPDGRSDIYSLGAVAYYTLTGRPPFDDERPLKVLLKHATEAPPPPSQFITAIPDDLERIVLRCLAKDPDDRFRSVQELAAALDHCEVAGKWGPAQAITWWRDHARNATRMPEASPTLEMSFG